MTNSKPDEASPEIVVLPPTPTPDQVAKFVIAIMHGQDVVVDGVAVKPSVSDQIQACVIVAKYSTPSVSDVVTVKPSVKDQLQACELVLRRSFEQS
jgi:hypothetical protein